MVINELKTEKIKQIAEIGFITLSFRRQNVLIVIAFWIDKLGWIVIIHFISPYKSESFMNSFANMILNCNKNLQTFI